MAGGEKVAITIRSVQDDGYTQHQTVQHYRGRLYRKQSHLYVMYSERDDDGDQTSTTLKLEAERVTMIRQGATRMHHTYALGKRTASVLHSAFGSLRMETDTLHFRRHGFPNAGEGAVNGKVEVGYRLHLNDQLAGTFDLSIAFWPVSQ